MSDKKKIGIIGGGQLGRMMVKPAHHLGFEVYILDPTPNSPAGQVADKQIIADFKDAEKIVELASEVDYLTFEIELADAEILDALAKTGAEVNPTGKTLSTIKDKLRQKKFLQDNNIPVADFVEITNIQEAQDAGEKFGYPFLLKARFDSYDGRGNALVQDTADITRAMHKLQGQDLYAERFVPFERELAVTAIRSTDGDIYTYTTVETIHKHHICHTVIAPAEISEKINEAARCLAADVLNLFDGAGVFAVEMFLTRNGKILVNEIAPRVHNNGHHSLDSCTTSQFENHIRAITDSPIGDTEMHAKHAVMINILGDRNDTANPQGIKEAEKIPGVSIYVYGKHDVKVERKMGHVTAVASTHKEALENAQKARALITI